MSVGRLENKVYQWEVREQGMSVGVMLKNKVYQWGGRE